MFKIISHFIISLLALLLFTGLTVNLHYCQNGLYDIAFNSPAAKCYEEGAPDHHQCRPGQGLHHPNQCDDMTVMLESTDDFYLSSNSFSFHGITSIVLNRGTSRFPDKPGKAGIEVPHFRKPPTPNKVILSQIQSFLI